MHTLDSATGDILCVNYHTCLCVLGTVLGGESTAALLFDTGHCIHMERGMVSGRPCDGPWLEVQHHLLLCVLCGDVSSAYQCGLCHPSTLHDV